MKLDSKEKYERLRKFVGQLKTQPNIDPFLTTEDIAKYGIYDFCYISKNPASFAKIQKKLKESKYDQLNEFTNDLKQIFVAVSDYAFEKDPIQQTVEYFQNEIDRFSDRFTEDFKPKMVYKSIKQMPTLQYPVVKKEKVEPKPRPPPAPVVHKEEPIPVLKDRPTNLLEKLEMLFLLRANENNEPYIRQIGRAYEIGEEVGDEYVITLDNRNTSWMQFLNKHE